MYAGQILKIDLTTGVVDRKPTASYAKEFLSGRGINAKIAFEETKAKSDPLDPDNPIIFGVGILCGMPAPDGKTLPAHRVEVTSKSPETGFLGTSNFGGSFAYELKRAGYDNIVIKGRSKNPVYIWIDNDTVEIRNADWLWGKDCYETQEAIETRLGEDVKTVCIGPAGENLVRFASLLHGKGHAGGRTGMGCVLGSKLVKAISVRGNKETVYADKDKCLSTVTELFASQDKRWWHREIAIRGMHRLVDEWKMFWDTDPELKPQGVSDLVKKYNPKRTGCLDCPTYCMEYYPKEAEGGTVISCGHYAYAFYTVKNTDPEVLLKCGMMAQRYGIDVVTSMSMVRWLMELHEEGLITASDTDGIEMKWGSGDAIIKLFEKIIRRDGIGDILADGIKPAAERIGRGSYYYTDEVKGLPYYGMSNPDALKGDKDIALNQAIATRGDTMRSHLSFETADNLKRTYKEQGKQAYADAVHQKLEDLEINDKVFDANEYEGKPARSILAEESIIMYDLLSICKLQNWHLGNIDSEHFAAEMVTAASGEKTSVDDLFTYARRVKNLERAFDIREGMCRELDTIPKRFFGRPAKGGTWDGAVIDRDKFEEMKSQYYALRGWDIESGRPTRKTLMQHGLEDVADALERGGFLPDGSNSDEEMNECLGHNDKPADVASHGELGTKPYL